MCGEFGAVGNGSEGRGAEAGKDMGKHVSCLHVVLVDLVLLSVAVSAELLVTAVGQSSGGLMVVFLGG